MPHLEPVLAHARDMIAASLGNPALEAETQVGKRMSTYEAIAFALDEKRPARTDSRVEAKNVSPLSKRELEIARLIADGMSNKEIAARCFLSERTVETHVSNILNKLGINSRVQVAGWVARELSPN
jgi:DNA-binding NarL/FixJ family response regulator